MKHSNEVGCTRTFQASACFGNWKCTIASIMGKINVTTLNVLIMQGNQWLAEARMIQAEQDQAYAESLAVDQAKVVIYTCMRIVPVTLSRMPKLNSSRYNIINTLQKIFVTVYFTQHTQMMKQQLRTKLDSRPIPADGMKFSVRLPDSTKLECTLSRDSSTKVRLLQINWLFSSISTSMSIEQK